MAVRSFLAFALACALAACAPGAPARPSPLATPSPGTGRSPRATVHAASPAPPAPATHDAVPPPGASAGPAAPAGHFTDLPVPGHRPARLWVPGGRAARPLIVVAHGAGGRAEWHCELWRGITGGNAFVLCPRGTRIFPRDSSGYFYRNDPALEREVLAAVGALRAAYPRVDPGPAVYAGYSQGAIMGALMAHRHPELFPRLVLVEGGHDWDIPTARRWHDGGGERVLFVCGRLVCDKDARHARGWLERAGVETRVEYAPGAGHTPAGRVAERIGAAFAWVVQGDDRWQAHDAVRHRARNQCVQTPRVAHNAPARRAGIASDRMEARGTAIAARGCPGPPAGNQPRSPP